MIAVQWCGNGKIMGLKENKNIFFERAKDKFGDNFDLSNVAYVNNKTKIDIVCKHHGLFSITPQQFLNSPCGCPKCSHEQRGRAISMTREYFQTMCCCSDAYCIQQKTSCSREPKVYKIMK